MITERRIPPGCCARIVACFFVPALVVLAVGSEVSGQDVVINEFLAVNDTTLTDEDGDTSDWLELLNRGDADVDLGGWHLTDDAADLRKWRLPALPLQAGGFVLVFASGKDRGAAGGELHTSFKLDAGGEYLALVGPDGVVRHEFAPAYPPQHGDISYGLASEVRTLVAAGGPADYLVPTSDALGASWRGADFVVDPSWESGATGIGYEQSGDEGGVPQPVSYWPFEGSVDDVVGSNHGEFVGRAAPIFVEGFSGPGASAVRFDGDGDYIDLAATDGVPVHNAPEYTVAMWVKGLPQSDKRVYSEGSSSNNNPLFTIGTDSSGASGRVDIFIRADSSRTLLRHRLSEGIAFDDSWHHIAWVDRGGAARVFIDGVRDAESFDYDKELLSLDVASIGAVLRASACCFFDGSIDEVTVWQRALNDDEIELVASGVPPGEGGSYEGLIATDVGAAMRGRSSSMYLRIAFALADPLAFDSLVLRMKYDDAFVAYINGTEVARRGAPPGLTWDSTALLEHSGADALLPESVGVSAGLAALRTGENVLAVHGLNVSADDASFLLLPELVGSAALGGEARFFAEPSPAGANRGGTIDFVADTKFSVDRGFYDEPMAVEITTETEGAEIRYTLDGSTPTETHGAIYTGAIMIDGTATLRAAAFKDGFQPTDVDTHTYIFLDDVIRQPDARPGYPSIWQGWPADYGMDPEIATDASSPHYAPDLKEALKSIPTLSLVLDPDDLMGPSRGIYTHSLSRGGAWERAASAELIIPGGEEDGFQINCGVRMQGGSSARPGEGKHAFRLLFKKEYGATKLEYPLFKDSPVDRFDTIVLRCFSTDSWHFKDGGSRYRRWDSQFIRDIWMKDSLRAMGQPSTHNTYVHLYLNGYYWGLYNPAERPDDSFNAAHHGGAKEDWDVIKDFNELFRGNRTAWNEFMRLSGSGLGSDAAYQLIQGNDPDGSPNAALPVYLDVDNLIDYMILHLYAASEDWPHHNWYAARNRQDGSSGWRFFVWDQEIVLDFQFRNRIGVNNANSPAFPYSRLRAHADFRMRFADRVQKHLFAGGALTNEAARRRWMERAAEIDRAVVAESARWGDYREDVADPSRSPAELYTYADHWLIEQEKVLEDYIPRSHTLAIQRFQAGDLYPDVGVPVLSQHGGRIPRGFVLELSAAGTVYYTLDGSDPRLPGGAVAPSTRAVGVGETEALLEAHAAAKMLVPTDGSAALDWTRVGFDDDAWSSATSAVGYERTSGFEDDFSTDVEGAMYDVSPSIYLRVPFEVADPREFTRMTLRMKYDDGFVAYLNGQRIAAENAPASPTWDARATASHADGEAQRFLEFDVTAGLDVLRAGENVLAIHGLNASATSSDFLIAAELAAGRASADSGVPLAETTIVKARTLNGGTWSALQETVFIIDEPLPLRITEIMYHPADPPVESSYDAGDFEFVELQNVGAQPLALLGVRLEGGIEFEFPTDEIAPLDAGEVVLLVKNLEAFESRYDTRGMYIAGEFAGSLANGGEDLVLRDANGEVVLGFFYDDEWHPTTDGLGASLEIIDALAAASTWGEPASWRAAPRGGTPGVNAIGAPPRGGLQRSGDANQDSGLDVSDAIAVLRHLFGGGGRALPCDGASVLEGGNLELFDVNGDGSFNLSDAVDLLGYLFSSGAPPAAGVDCIRIEGCPDVCR